VSLDDDRLRRRRSCRGCGQRQSGDDDDEETCEPHATRSHLRSGLRKNFLARCGLSSTRPLDRRCGYSLGSPLHRARDASRSKSSPKAVRGSRKAKSGKSMETVDESVTGSVNPFCGQ
jgi:hypothetical protein